MFTIFAVNKCSFKIMSPRITRLRKVLNPPVIAGFRPYGPETGKQNSEPIFLLFEEYEALRLCDFDMYNHHQASGIMGVSRPTFTRIYSSTRQKIAKAFVEGRPISIEGGKVYFDSDWYRCKNCDCYFNNTEREKEITACPLCNSHQVVGFDHDNAINGFDTAHNDDICRCPHCGLEQSYEKEKPCVENICPKCNAFMKKRGMHKCAGTKVY